jgi:hypothetical protein
MQPVSCNAVAKARAAHAPFRVNPIVRSPLMERNEGHREVAEALVSSRTFRRESDHRRLARPAATSERSHPRVSAMTLPVRFSERAVLDTSPEQRPPCTETEHVADDRIRPPTVSRRAIALATRSACGSAGSVSRHTTAFVSTRSRREDSVSSSSSATEIDAGAKRLPARAQDSGPVLTPPLHCRRCHASHRRG